MRQGFNTIDVLRLDVERDLAPGEIVNGIQNPIGRLGGWGWVTPVPLSLMTARTFQGTLRLSYNPGSSGLANYFHSEAIATAPGLYAAAEWQAPDSTISGSDRAHRARFEWLDAAGTVLSASTQSGYFTAALTRRNLAPVAAPAGTAYVRIRFDYYESATGAPPAAVGAPLDLRWVVVAVATTTAALSVLPITLPQAYFTNVLGTSNEITVERDELDLGVLNAVAVGPTLDPSQSALVRPGRRVRLRTVNVIDGTEQDVFTGKITNGKATYDLTRRPAKRAKVTLSAVDDTASLGRYRPEGVASVDDLPYVLEGCGVPWSCNGSGSQVRSADVVATNDQASALDQVVLTRDSNLGYAWLDRSGVLQVWDRDTISTAVVATLDESTYNASGLVIDYDTDRCINTVAVTFLRQNATTGETEEIAYGPYRDEPSIAEWGVHSAEFKIQWSIENEAEIAALAAAILTANATPVVRVNEVTIPLDTTAKVFTHGVRDLYDLVTVVNTNAGISEAYRVTTIKHTITNDKWLLTLGFAADGGVASPTFVPSPSGGAGGLTFTQLLQPLGHVEMFYGAKADITPGWLALDGSTFDAATYPRLATHLGGSTLPDFTDRFPIGAGTKALGTSGGSPTQTLTVPNLPPHAHPVQTSSAVGATTGRLARGGTAGTGNTAEPVGNTGSGTPFDVMPPWRALWFIIRAV